MHTDEELCCKDVWDWLMQQLLEDLQILLRGASWSVSGIGPWSTQWEFVSHCLGLGFRVHEGEALFGLFVVLELSPGRRSLPGRDTVFYLRARCNKV
jgi:hypothetical protein